MPIVIETFDEWVKRHGQPLEIFDETGTTTNRCITPDGALCNADDHNIRREPPPQNSWEMVRLYRDYSKEQLRRAEDRFNRLKSEMAELSGQAKLYSNLPAPSPLALKDLKRHKSDVIVWRAKLRTWLEILEGSPEAMRRKHREQYAQQRFSQIISLESQIKDICLNDR